MALIQKHYCCDRCGKSLISMWNGNKFAYVMNTDTDNFKG